MNTKRTRGVVATAAVLGTVGALGVSLPASAVAPSTAPLLAPYFTELDLTGDDQVTTADLDVAASALGLTSGAAGWADVAVIDTDADGAVTVADLAGLAQRMIYDDGPFELVEASVLDMQAAMNAGVTTSVEITQGYIDRIAAYDDALVDQGAGGRPLNSIITVGSAALEAAAAADAERAAEGMTSMLLGVPIAVKDNYNTVDMVTTGGCGCWNDNQTATDAFMVQGLRDAGAVVLAKASLDEFAYGFASEFSSFHEPGTSTLVASPYFTDRTAGGSSGGTGAAIAANLAGIGFGTDTGGSIRVPSSYNQLVGVRPTVGLASRDGIIPLALSQDTGGPMTRTVSDAAIALDSVAGYDAEDPITAESNGMIPATYTASLDDSSLQGARIGYVPSIVGTNPAVLRLFNQAKADLEAQGFTGLTVADQIGAIQTVINGIIGVLNAFAVIALIAAGFGIVNTLLMSVQERTREIGLMKAMGMGGGKIFALFSVEAIFIGFLGSALGAGVAVGLGSVISSVLSDTVLSSLPGLHIMLFTPASVATIIGVVMLIAFLAGTLPARRAARQNPIDALRYE